MILSLLGPGRVWATLDADGQLWAAALATGASDWAWEARQSARIASTIHCARPMLAQSLCLPWRRLCRRRLAAPEDWRAAAAGSSPGLAKAAPCAGHRSPP